MTIFEASHPAHFWNEYWYFGADEPPPLPLPVPPPLLPEPPSEEEEATTFDVTEQLMEPHPIVPAASAGAAPTIATTAVAPMTAMIATTEVSAFWICFRSISILDLVLMVLLLGLVQGR
ncbi:hypothetical protein [Curtobacterium sp. MCBA15_001]|uniref:hypothetical protein n=1 Tax=Curtobacterium sp. MCBA15_001 TaxID=1898731 RepID=UPI0015874E1F|nr:hypothetical protein [Curtobacterium sp. MCBA15_001]